MHRYIALAGLIFAPACLNPDISDEYPLTMEAEALDTDDGGSASDDSAQEEESAEDDEAADDDDTPRPDFTARDSEGRNRRARTRR